MHDQPEAPELIVAIDETGSFTERKLQGVRGFRDIDETGSFIERKLQGVRVFRSGMVAVLSDLEPKSLESYLQRLGDKAGLRYPGQFHAGKVLNKEGRRELNLQLSQEEAQDAVSAVQQGMRSAILSLVGVHESAGRRRYFHEQQAYGEMLMALLHEVAIGEGQRLESVNRVRVYLASRKHPELVGFEDVEEYHQRLADFLEQRALPPPWPKGTKIVIDYATRNPYLMLADFFAGLVVEKPDWSRPMEELHQPAIWDALLDFLGRTDRVGHILIRLEKGEGVRASSLLEMPNHPRFEALRRLTSAAHRCVSDRHDRGDMLLSMRIADLAWDVAEASGLSLIQGELCTIAAQVFSHQGRDHSDPDVARWRARSNALPGSSWASSSLAAAAVRLEYRCQAAQIDLFNVFCFEDAYLEFVAELEEYEATVGTEVADGSVVDELYGKLLGTIGQAAGFLRAQYPELGDEAWRFLERSAPHFAHSSPAFKAMNLGYRLTDLWDRGCLVEAGTLAVAEHLPGAAVADPYALLHRLRIAAASHHLGIEHEPVTPLIQRLLELLSQPKTLGSTPFDLCLKWAIFLVADEPELRQAAIRWMDGLDCRHTALVATSLPLLVQLGQHDVSVQRIADLRQHPGFQAHWATARAEPLARAVSDRTEPDYPALRAMPWNYS